MNKDTEVIDFREKLNERTVKKLMKSLDELNGKASEIKREFTELVKENPKEAIDRLPNYLKRIRNVNPDGTEAVAGGPYEGWTGSILNIASIIYPDISRELRKKLLVSCLNFLDHLNYVNAQDQVALIEEPLLVRDIIINIPLYWPGFKNYTGFLENNQGIVSFVKNLPDIGNNFWLALAIIWGDDATLPVRQWYYEQFPDLVNGALEFVAAKIFYQINSNPQKSEKCLIEFDPTFHKKIKKKMVKGDWIKLDLTRR